MLVPCALAALASAAPASARPLIIEDSATIENPDPAKYRQFGFDVATNGDYAFVAASDTTSDIEVLQYYLLQYRLVNGQWTFQRELAHIEHYYDSYSYPFELAMEGNLAAVGWVGHSDVYQLDAGTWTQVARLPLEPSDYIRMDGGRILLSDGGWNGQVAERDAAGAWTTTFLMGQPRGNDDEFWGGPLDILGDRVILGTPYTQDLEPQEIPIYQRTGPQAWNLYTKLQVPQGTRGLGAAVGLNADDAIVDGRGGAYVWRAPYFAEPVGRMQAIDSAMPQSGTPVIETAAGQVFYRRTSADLGSVAHLFRAGAQGRYVELATLVPRNGAALGWDVSVAGSTVMIAGTQRVHVFQLPSSYTGPAARYDNFENGAAAWTPSASAQFAVTGTAANHVYRQSSVVGDARALLGNSQWTEQAIEADIRAIEFSGSDRWFGLVTRYQDAQNFFYVTLRNSGTVQLRRVRNGAVSELARATLAVTTNRTYRVRLESYGGTHRVYVDGQLLLDVDVAGPVDAGSPGLAMYRTRADFDNVIASPGPRGTIYRSDFSSTDLAGWAQSGMGQWSVRDGVLAQDSIGGDARAAIGTPTGDQIVQARVRPLSYAPASGTQERWAGVFARFTDPQNFYYLSLRSGNTVSLRKVVNGAITVLASVPFTVNTNTPHLLRLETVGTQLRGYVDGALLLQASDAALSAGSGGLVSYKAAANFDDYAAYQP